ncbi:MAG: hypothetical protein K9N47_02285 [Prosthecobacter sp.]|uniref:hypothetical protein n=1 Tax=Prosthecobacter sp. TaxID=1965333 RepID=UPI0025F7DCCF|nr:hypothetical protein [Prosthecobacter sp.]MCF7784917.1 hypothetical protein [Prosthecobacter sp.]
MNQKIKEELAELSYLWTSGEWGLRSIHHSRARIILIFQAGRPSLQELIAVRSLVPKFAQSPVSLLKTEVGDVPMFTVGEFGNLEARRLESEAKARRLEVRREDVSFTGYLPVNVQGAALVIEDDELASLATEEMRRRGVPIMSYEEHD